MAYTNKVYATFMYKLLIVIFFIRFCFTNSVHWNWTNFSWSSLSNWFKGRRKSFDNNLKWNTTDMIKCFAAFTKLIFYIPGVTLQKFCSAFLIFTVIPGHPLYSILTQKILTLLRYFTVTSCQSPSLTPPEYSALTFVTFDPREKENCTCPLMISKAIKSCFSLNRPL